MYGFEKQFPPQHHFAEEKQHVFEAFLVTDAVLSMFVVGLTPSRHLIVPAVFFFFLHCRHLMCLEEELSFLCEVTEIYRRVSQTGKRGADFKPDWGERGTRL